MKEVVDTLGGLVNPSIYHSCGNDVRLIQPAWSGINNSISLLSSAFAMFSLFYKGSIQLKTV